MSRKRLTAVVTVTFLGVTAVGCILAYTVLGGQQVTREYPIDGVTTAQCGNSRVKLIFDGQDKIVLRTARRNLLTAMVRVEGGPRGKFVQFGYYDDADPRVLLGLPNGDDDALEFELHTGTLERIAVAGGATLTADSLKTDDFGVESLTERPIVLRGINVDVLRVFMQAGDVTVQGRAKTLYLMNSSDHGEFIDDGFTASESKSQAEEALP